MRPTTYAARDGLKLICTEIGDGSPVVLLHAGGERREVFLPVGRRLAAAGWRAILVDQRGHGETGGTGACLSEYVDDACAIVAHTSGPAWIVGCSLGGLVALLATQSAGAHVAGVVLIDVVPEPDGTRARAYLRRVESQGLPLNWSLVEDILGRRPAVRDAAARCRVPIMLIRGERGLVSDEDIRALRLIVPSLVTRTVSGAGHLVARDQPEALADVLVELLPGALSPASTRGLLANEA